MIQPYALGGLACGGEWRGGGCRKAGRAPRPHWRRGRHRRQSIETSRREGCAAEIVATRHTLFRLAGHSIRAADHPRKVRRRRKARYPTWGRSEATQSGGVLLAPLPGERKCAIKCPEAADQSQYARSNSAASRVSSSATLPQPADPAHAHRSLPARHSAECRNDVTPVCLLRHRGPYHRTVRFPDHRPRLPSRRHGLSRCGDDRAARLLAGL